MLSTRVPGSRHAWRAGLCALLAVACAARVDAAEHIRLRNIGGRLCARVTIRTPAAEVPAWMLLDLGSRGPLLVHERTGALLGIQDQGTADLVFEDAGLTLSGVQAVSRGIELLEDVTRNHANELDNIPAAAILGMPALEGYWIELNGATGEMRLAHDPSELPEIRENIAFPLQTRGHGYWMEFQRPSGQSWQARLGTTEPDTLISATIITRLKQAREPVGALRLGEIEVTRFTALRPADFKELPDPKPDIMIGTGLLSSFAITLPPDRQQILWRQVAPPSPNVEVERSLFDALLADDADGVLAFLSKNPQHRLASLAAEALLEIRSHSGAIVPPAIREALDWIARTTPEEKRARALLDASDAFIELAETQPAWYDQASVALDLAKDSVSSDPDDAAVHHLNARRGLVALMREDYTQARRFLLSAAFGLPRDGYVNLWLGRLYEVTGQTARAWSRYLQSALAQGAPLGASKGLDRLNRDPAWRRTFTMLDAESLLEGRVPVFVPGGQFRPAPGVTAPRLIELFVNSDDKPTQAAQMAFDALGSYLEDQPTLFLQYHLRDVLGSKVSERRAQACAVEQTPTALFDGGGACSEGGDDKAVARVFSEYVARFKSSSSEAAVVELTGSARFADNTVSVEVTCRADRSVRVRAMLSEQAVMAIGENKLIMHHHVVRGELSPEAGWTCASGQERFGGRAELAAVREELEGYITGLEKERGGTAPMRPTWIDVRHCRVTAFAEDPESGRVLAATAIPITMEKAQD